MASFTDSQRTAAIEAVRDAIDQAGFGWLVHDDRIDTVVDIAFTANDPDHAYHLLIAELDRDGYGSTLPDRELRMIIDGAWDAASIAAR